MRSPGLRTVTTHAEKKGAGERPSLAGQWAAGGGNLRPREGTRAVTGLGVEAGAAGRRTAQREQGRETHSIARGELVVLGHEGRRRRRVDQASRRTFLLKTISPARMGRFSEEGRGTSVTAT